MKQFYSLLRVICLLCPFILTSFFATCDDEPSNPPPNPIDSTSHSFVFFTDTLGGKLSWVNDVFCLSETEAYAVGLFYVRDSIGKVIDSLTCNFAKWDGVKWKLERVNPKLNGMQTFAELVTVFAFTANDIWVNYRHWNGKEWTPYDLNSIARGGTRKLWAKNPNDVYSVGENGSIVHWDGQKFQELAGEITTAANCDIWGWKDTIYVATSDYDRKSGAPGYTIRIVNGNVIGKEMIQDGEQTAIWGINGVWYTAGCSGIYRKSGGNWKMIRDFERCYSDIRGTELNNVFIGMEEAKVLHYNGSTWAEIHPFERSGLFFPGGLSVVGKSIFFSGNINQHAIVYRGYQQPIK